MRGAGWRVAFRRRGGQTGGMPKLARMRAGAVALGLFGATVLAGCAAGAEPEATTSAPSAATSAPAETSAPPTSPPPDEQPEQNPEQDPEHARAPIPDCETVLPLADVQAMHGPDWARGDMLDMFNPGFEPTGEGDYWLNSGFNDTVRGVLQASPDTVRCMWGVPNSGARTTLFATRATEDQLAAVASSLAADGLAQEQVGDETVYVWQSEGGIDSSKVYFWAQGGVLIAEIGSAGPGLGGELYARVT